MSRQHKIITDSLLLGARQAVTLVLIALQTLFAAKYLGPSGFGTFAIVSVLSMMAAVGTPGFLAAAGRELPHYRARNDQATEAAILNHVVCGELAVTALWAVIIAVIAMIQESVELAVCLLLVAATVVPAKAVGLYQLISYVEKDFDFLSRGTLLMALLAAGLVVGLVWKLGLYIVFLAPLAASVAGIAYYRTRYRLRIRPGKLELTQFKRLASIGLPMTGLTVVSGNNGLQRWGERGLLEIYLGSAALGIYAFYVWVTLAFHTVFGGVLQALQPHIYELLSGELDERRIDQAIVQPIWVITVLALLAVGFAMVVLPDIIISLLPEYVAGMAALYALLLATLISCIYWIPGIMMSAARFNAQGHYLRFWCLSVGLSLVSATIMLQMGWDMLAVAIGYLLSQAFMLVLTFRHLWRYLFSTPGSFGGLVRELALPGLNVAVAAGLILAAGLASGPPPSGMLSHAIAAVLKASAFVLLSVPTLMLLEKRTAVYSGHIRPAFKRLIAR